MGCTESTAADAANANSNFTGNATTAKDHQHHHQQAKCKRRLSDGELNRLSIVTHFPVNQIKQWHAAFLEECPSGTLSRKTFVNFFAKLFPNDRAVGFYQHLFRSFDTDQNDCLDFSEFLTATSTTQTGSPEEKLNLAFQLYDIDRNGTIELDELADIIKAILLMAPHKSADNGTSGESSVMQGGDPSLPEEIRRAQIIFDKMDANRDRRLSKDEFVRGCLDDTHLFETLLAAR